MRTWIVVFLALVFWFMTVSPAAAQTRCADYPTQAAAQAAYRANPTGLAMLDRDRDGVACESNRCPCDRTPVPIGTGPAAPAPAPARPASPAPAPAAPVVPAQTAPGAAPASAAAPAPPEVHAWAVVTRVVDGDTVDVLFDDGATARVRLIGVDTPETVDPRRPVGCFGAEASAYTRELVDGRRVWLERDVSQTDRFGRLLRYVWLDDDTLANEQLVADGYAQVVTFPPDVAYVERLRAAQAIARTEGRGLWTACADRR